MISESLTVGYLGTSNVKSWDPSLRACEIDHGARPLLKKGHVCPPGSKWLLCKWSALLTIAAEPSVTLFDVPLNILGEIAAQLYTLHVF